MKLNIIKIIIIIIIICYYIILNWIKLNGPHNPRTNELPSNCKWRFVQFEWKQAVPHDCVTLDFSSVRFAPREDREWDRIYSHSDDRVELKRLTPSDDKRTRWQLIFNLGQSSRRGPKLDCLGHVISGRELLQSLARKPPSSTIFVNWEYLKSFE